MGNGIFVLLTGSSVLFCHELDLFSCHGKLFHKLLIHLSPLARMAAAH